MKIIVNMAINFILYVVALFGSAFFFRALYVPNSFSHAINENIFHGSDAFLYAFFILVIIVLYIINLLINMIFNNFQNRLHLYFITGVFFLLCSNVSAFLNHVSSIIFVVAFSGFGFYLLSRSIYIKALKWYATALFFLNAFFMLWINYLSGVEIASIYFVVLMYIYIVLGIIFTRLSAIRKA